MSSNLLHLQTKLVLVALLVVGATAFSPRPHHFKHNYVNQKHKQADLKSVDPPEVYLKNIRQITLDGVNAEAYWSFDGTQFSFQAIRGPLAQSHPCDQIYTMNVNGTNVRLVSNGEGRDTCSYFTPDGQYVIYSSTRSVDGQYCAPTPDMNYGYLWPIYSGMEIYKVRLSDGNLQQLTSNNFYDAETTISVDGTKAVFTSSRDGDLELYTMNLDGTGVRRMTYTPGYDGGAWFSHDGKKLVWRASRPQGANLTNYLNLLKTGLVEPSDMQIFVMDVNNTETQQQLTNIPGAANFAPVFTPDDKAIVFSSNMKNIQGGEFQMYLLTLDGNITQITYQGMFNSFPMFSPDGKYIAWESSRNAINPTDINIFIAEWNPPSNYLKNVAKVNPLGR